jgi:uncharacterized protein
MNGNIFALTKEKYALLNKAELNVLKESHPLFLSAMKKVGVIIPSNFNEMDWVKMHNRQTIFNTHEYRLTVNPTLECNFNCWYCYENHPKGVMNNSTMLAIVRHVEKIAQEQSLRYINLDWFGGEPLLYFDDVVYPLSKKVRKIAISNKIFFSNTITTNGYLINSDKITKFKEIGLNNFQITLDGDEETHNKVRFGVSKEGSFQKIIENINLLAENSENIISVRINYTAKTLEKINDIIDLFSAKAKAKILVFFQQVWQDSARKNVSAEKNKKVFEERGIKVSKYKLNTKGYVCYADRFQQAVINFDGKVFKCTARDFSTSKADGILLPNGEIKWDAAMISKRLGNATFENEFCKECNLLPACMGPCSQKMVKFSPDRDFRTICQQGGVQLVLEEQVDNFYKQLKIT